MNKKGLDLTLNTMIIVIILMVTMVVILYSFYSFTNAGKEDTKGIFDSIGSDFDGDGKKDAVDPCPCEAHQEAPCGMDANQCYNDMQAAKEKQSE